MKPTAWLAWLASILVTTTLDGAAARACPAPFSVMPYALPRPTSTPISTATTIYIVSDSRPAWVEVTAGGVPLKTDGVKLVGQMYAKGEAARLWRVMGLADSKGVMLQASTEHVVSVTYGGKKRELTRFTTAAGYDKVQGTAPLLRSIKLWRVHYPPGQIRGCVSSEYHAFIELDYDPAAIPDTPKESTLYTVVLWPKNGGKLDTISFTGQTPFNGGAPKLPYYEPERPAWPSIELDPTQVYCALLKASGYGDIARLPLEDDSNRPCAKVTSVGSDGAGAKDGERESGCSLQPAAPGLPWWALATLIALALWRAARRRP